MRFEEFHHLARLYVIGALDEDEMVSLEAGRARFGAQADECIAECRRLEAAFALSLQPRAVQAGAKRRLLSLIRNSGGVLASQRERQRRTGKDRALHDLTESDLVD